MRVFLRWLLVWVLAIPAYASRDEASNQVATGLSGDVQVTSRWVDTLTGNVANFQRDFELPDQFFVPQLDLFYDLSAPATLDLKLRAPLQSDQSAFLRFRDLRAFTLWVYYSESYFFDFPIQRQTKRRYYRYDYYMNRFPQHPIELFFEATSFQGDGQYITRNYDFMRGGLWGDFRVGESNTGFARLSLNIPVFTYRDHHRPINDVNNQEAALAFHRSFDDFFYSLSLAARVGQLPNLHESYTMQTYYLNMLSTNTFGFHDVNTRLQLEYHNRTREVVRNFHYEDYLLGDFTVSITPIEHASAQLGLAVTNASTLRLTRPGINRLDASAAVPTISDLKAQGAYDKNNPDALQAYIKLYFNTWHQLSGHYRYSNTKQGALPNTDVTLTGSPTLFADRLSTEEFRLNFAPGHRYLFQVSRTMEDRNNHSRYISTRTDYLDFYASVLVWQHFTIGGGLSNWDQSSNQEIVGLRLFLQRVRAKIFNISWDFRKGLAIFMNLREMDNEGPDNSTEHFAETGVKFGSGKKSGFDGRLSIFYDHLKSKTNPSVDYRHSSLNLSARTHF
jgi:hypothetical protein